MNGKDPKGASDNDIRFIAIDFAGSLKRLSMRNSGRESRLVKGAGATRPDRRTESQEETK